MDATKKCLRRSVEPFRQPFGDQPTQALGAVSPTTDLQKRVVEEIGTYRERIDPPLTPLGLFIGQALSQDQARSPGG